MRRNHQLVVLVGNVATRLVAIIAGEPQGLAAESHSETGRLHRVLRRAHAVESADEQVTRRNGHLQIDAERSRSARNELGRQLPRVGLIGIGCRKFVVRPAAAGQREAGVARRPDVLDLIAHDLIGNHIATLLFPVLEVVLGLHIGLRDAHAVCFLPGPVLGSNRILLVLAEVALGARLGRNRRAGSQLEFRRELLDIHSAHDESLHAVVVDRRLRLEYIGGKNATDDVGLRIAGLSFDTRAQQQQRQRKDASKNFFHKRKFNFTLPVFGQKRGMEQR